MSQLSYQAMGSNRKEIIDFCKGKANIDECKSDYQGLPPLKNPPKVTTNKPISIEVIPYVITPEPIKSYSQPRYSNDRYKKVFRKSRKWPSQNENWQVDY